MSPYKRTPLDEQLRQAIQASGLTIHAVSVQSGVANPIVNRFVRGARGLSLETADRLAEFLGLELAPIVRKRGARG